MNMYAIILLLISLIFFVIGYKTRFRDDNAVKVIELNKVKKENQLIYIRRFSHTMNAVGLGLSLSAIVTLFTQRITIISISIIVVVSLLAVINLIKINKLYKDN